VTSIESSQWAAKDILGHYHTLGIPHFQRGLVWGAEATSLLLESIFLDTPCGTIILWEPVNPQREGLPLLRRETLRYLIVDGQQRVRSLYSALSLTEDGSDPEDSDNGAEGVESGKPGRKHRLWCVNLARVPELEGLVPPSVSRFPLFRLVIDPRTDGAPFKHNYIPLRDFRGGRVPVDLKQLLQPAETFSKEQVIERIMESRLPERIDALWSNSVFSTRVMSQTGQESRHCITASIAPESE